MYNQHYITVIIPVLNEEKSIQKVLEDIPGFVDTIIISDNGSTDNTARIAESLGVQVVSEPERGYGAACLKALEHTSNRTDILVFLDGDYSDYPEEMGLLLNPIVYHNYDVVIGSRMLKAESKQHLTPVAGFGNWLSTKLIKLIWNYNFTDLGPFRAVRYSSFQKLEMQDRNFGWTIELQIKAAKHNLNAKEIPVSYRQRIGESKISGTLMGTVKAGTKILYLIFKELF